MILNSNKLKKKSLELRKKIFRIVCKKGGHLSTAYSAVEILVSLYFTDILKINSTTYRNNDRNFFLLSKGHGETLLYAVLVEKKIISKNQFNNHYRSGSHSLGGHVDIKTPGIEITSGALGHGLSIGCGIALGKKKINSKKKTFILLGDAECSEGTIWEAALFAKKNKLDNLIAIIDNNKIGATDFTSNFSSVDPLDTKFKSFGWESKIVDGHSIKEIYQNLKRFTKSKNKKPKVLICETTKGKGLDFLENDPSWHSRPLSEELKLKGYKLLGLKNEK